MSTAEPMTRDSHFTVEDIDDILDEIEEREAKTLLVEKFDHRLKLKPTQSLDIELEMAEATQQIPSFDQLDFDPRCLLNGYFIIHCLHSFQCTKHDTVSQIIDLCILYTFDDIDFIDDSNDSNDGDHQSQRSQSQTQSGDDDVHQFSYADPTSPSPFSPSVGIQGIDDQHAKSHCLMHEQHRFAAPATATGRGADAEEEEEDETSASELDEEEMCAIMVPFGHAQSPINIITKATSPFAPQLMDDTELWIENPLRFNYPSMVKNCSVINNGHTVQINVPGNKARCSLVIKNKLYRLRQFHFHTPSEHTVDGKQYEMEMHLVHVNEENEIAVLGFIFSTKQTYKKPALQLSKSRMHLVLQKHPAMKQKESKDSKKSKKGQLYVSSVKEAEEVSGDESDDMETDDEEDGDHIDGGHGHGVEKEDEDGDECKKQQQGKRKGNDFLEQFWNELPANKTEHEVLLSKPISFDYLFETSSNNFSKNVETNEVNIDMEIYEYMGSLTTPPYTEGVQWLVSKTLHFINEQQLEKLRSCWNHENNARPTQGYYGRSVQLRSQSSFRVLQ